MINYEADEVIKKVFKSLLNRYQDNLGKSMKGSKFVFDYVHLLYHKCHIINLNHGESYIDSPVWIKSKKVATNLINKKCFQYSVTVALNHEEIEKHGKE